jgi:hypothetical protein
MKMSPRKRVEKTEVSAEEETVEVSAVTEVAVESPESVLSEVEGPVTSAGSVRRLSEVEGPVTSAGSVRRLSEVEGEAAEVSTAAEEETPSAEAGTVAGGEEMGVKKVNLKTLARNLYQMGLNLGLPPDEAALRTSETKLPTFISAEGEKEFKGGLVEAYQAMLDERLQSLKQKLGMDG